MVTKRKHNASSPPNQDRLPPNNDGTASTSPHNTADAPAESYPRKRIAIACNVCRFRKTRCDAVKPSCGFCTDLGIECTYRTPTIGDRAKPAADPHSEALVSLEHRLSQLEARLDYTQQMIQNPSIFSPNFSSNSDMVPSHGSVASRISSANRHIAEHLNASSNEDPVSHDIAYRQSSTDKPTSRPSLLTFRAPSYIPLESYDYTAEFYDDEILAGEQLCEKFHELLLMPIDLSNRTTRRLQQSFVENFLRWTPIFDQGACVKAVEHAAAGNFSLQDPSTCITFMLLALGAISEVQNGSPDTQEPGLDYFARGCQILERLALRTGSLTTLQCRVLQASYFKFTMRPMQAWNAITQAARDCMHLLTSRVPERMSRVEQEAMHRVFWAVSTILHELEATMRMHPIGLRYFHELVPLPQFEEEDPGFYYFLAQISLRKFLTQSLEVVGYRSGQVIYAPVVTEELRKQVQEWYDHLPSIVRFPLNATPVFDSRKSFLRCQYNVLFLVLGWPSVVKIIEHGEGYGPTLSRETLAVTRDQAQVCIKSCCMFLSVADEQLVGRRMGTHFSLYAAYATIATLIITFNRPALAFVEETRQEHHIRNGYEILRPWSHLPLIGRGLDRIRIMMQQAGLADIGHVSGGLAAGATL